MTDSNPNPNSDIVTAEVVDVPYRREQETSNSNWFFRADLIIGLICVLLLAAIAIPLLMMFRGLSGRERCFENIRQISMAAINYELAHDVLPSATLGAPLPTHYADWTDIDHESYWRIQSNVSALGQLRSELEIQSPAVVRIAPGIWQADMDGAIPMATQRVPTLICPLDRDETLVDIVIATQPITRPLSPNGKEPVGFHDDLATQAWPLTNVLPGADKVPSTGSADEVEYRLHRTSYLANGGVTAGAGWASDELKRYVGPIYSRSKTTSAGCIDGASHTILFGETAGEMFENKRLQSMSWYWGGQARGRGGIPYHFDLDSVAPIGYDETKLVGGPAQASVIGFGSHHRNDVTFSFLDGSIHSFERGIAQDVYFAFLGASDGDKYFDESLAW